MPADRAAKSPDELALLRTVVANPLDPVALSVYTDFLEEHADPRGAFLREFVREYPTRRILPEPPPDTAVWADVLGIAARKYLRRKPKEFADNILRQSLPAIRVTAGDVLPDDAPLGTTRFGGGPDLPESMAGLDTSCFLFQLDLADLRGTLADGMFPEAGLLVLFSYYGEAPAAVYAPPGTRLVRVASAAEDPMPLRAAHLSDALRFIDTDLSWDEMNDLATAAGVSVGRGGHWLATPCADFFGPVNSENEVPDAELMELANFDDDSDLGLHFHDGDDLHVHVPLADARVGRFDRVTMYDAT